MYESYYGFDSRPFQLTPDPQFYFDSRTHRKALSYLGYGLAQGEGFIVITGEIGAGKTTLVGHLMETIDRDRLNVAQIVTSQLSGDDLLKMAAQQFGLSVAGLDKAGLLKALEGHFQAEARDGRRCLLIVDEAQNLERAALEQLRMLSNFQLGNQALLQIFLLGQPEFRDTLRSDTALEQLRQRIIATHHLEGMQPDEVEPYIQHRLARVGSDGRPTFSGDAITLIAEETDGIPRSLNRLMSRVLLMGAIEETDDINAELVARVIADLAEDLPTANIGEALEMAVEEEPVCEAEAEIQAEPMQVAQAVLQASDMPVAQADSTAMPTPDAADKAVSQEPVSSAALNIDPADFRASIDRICAIEARMAEQERSLRRLLVRLVRWVESEDMENRRDAA